MGPVTRFPAPTPPVGTGTILPGEVPQLPPATEPVRSEPDTPPASPSDPGKLWRFPLYAMTLAPVLTANTVSDALIFGQDPSASSVAHSLANDALLIGAVTAFRGPKLARTLTLATPVLQLLARAWTFADAYGFSEPGSWATLLAASAAGIAVTGAGLRLYDKGLNFIHEKTFGNVDDPAESYRRLYGVRDEKPLAEAAAEIPELAEALDILDATLREDRKGLRTFFGFKHDGLDVARLLDHVRVGRMDKKGEAHAYYAAETGQVFYADAAPETLAHELLHALHHRALYEGIDAKIAKRILYWLPLDEETIGMHEVLDHRDSPPPLSDEWRWHLATRYFLHLAGSDELEAVATSIEDTPPFAARLKNWVWKFLFALQLPATLVAHGGIPRPVRGLLGYGNAALYEKTRAKGLFGDAPERSILGTPIRN